MNIKDIIINIIDIENCTIAFRITKASPRKKFEYIRMSKKINAQRAPHRNDLIGTRVACHRVPASAASMGAAKGTSTRARLECQTFPLASSSYTRTEIHTVHSRGVINRHPSVCDSSGIPGRSIKSWCPIGRAWSDKRRVFHA